MLGEHRLGFWPLLFVKQVRRGSLEGGEIGCLLRGWIGFVPSHQHPLGILAPAMRGLLLCPRRGFPAVSFSS